MAPPQAQGSPQVAATLASRTASRVELAIHPPRSPRSKSPNLPARASAALSLQTCPWVASFPPNTQRCRRPNTYGSLVGTVQCFCIAGLHFDEAPLLRDDIQQLCAPQFV